MSTPPELEEWVTVADVAQLLRLSHRAIIHRIHRGKIAARKFGGGATSAYLISRDEVERLLQELEAAA